MSEQAADAVPGALDLDAIEDRAREAAPGPWTVTASYDPEINIDVCDADGNLVGSERQAFIAAARMDVPALVAEVRRLRAKLACAGCGDEMDSGCDRCDADADRRAR